VDTDQARTRHLDERKLRAAHDVVAGCVFETYDSAAKEIVWKVRIARRTKVMVTGSSNCYVAPVVALSATPAVSSTHYADCHNIDTRGNTRPVINSAYHTSPFGTARANTQQRVITMFFAPYHRAIITARKSAQSCEPTYLSYCRAMAQSLMTNQCCGGVLHATM